MKITYLFFLIGTFTLSMNSFSKENFSQTKSFKVKSLKASSPTALEVKFVEKVLGNFGASDSGEYVDCFSFCDEVCAITPGGVCYCDSQSYSCPGDPVSY